MDNQIIKEEIIKLNNRIKELIGNKKLPSGFLIKDYDKLRLFKFDKQDYIDYYGKDDSYYYYINNENKKEAKKEYSKKNNKDNKEKIKENITCDCGCIISKFQKSRHEKTDKHFKLLNEILKMHNY